MGKAVEAAYQAIREGILTGTYAQGSHITAQHLAEVSGFSRTPVREAMRRLHAERLIELIPNRGAFVSKWTEDEIRQHYELCVLLESFAAEEAARRATPEQIATMSEYATQMREMLTRLPVSPEAVAAVNDKFHKAVMAAAGNNRLQDVLISIIDMPLVLNTFRNYTYDELHRSAEQHIELVSAVAARDPVWARSIMTAHIRFARQTLTRILGKTARADAEGADRNGSAVADDQTPAPKKRRKARRQSPAKDRAISAS